MYNSKYVFISRQARPDRMKCKKKMLLVRDVNKVATSLQKVEPISTIQ